MNLFILKTNEGFFSSWEIFSELLFHHDCIFYDRLKKGFWVHFNSQSREKSELSSTAEMFTSARITSTKIHPTNKKLCLLTKYQYLHKDQFYIWFC